MNFGKLESKFLLGLSKHNTEEEEEENYLTNLL